MGHPPFIVLRQVPGVVGVAWVCDSSGIVGGVLVCDSCGIVGGVLVCDSFSASAAFKTVDTKRVNREF